MKHSRVLSSTVASSALALSLSFAAAGCGSSEPAPGPLGSSETDSEHLGGLSLGLSVAPGVELATASYTVTGPGGFDKSGSIDLTSSSKIAATIAGLPAGSGYAVTLSATSVSGSTACAGSASFSVTAQRTTSLTLAVACKESAKTGSVLVNGALNLCAVADGISAVPSDLFVGGSTTLAGLAHDSDAAPSALSYQWSTSSGTLSSTSAPNPSFTCTSAGEATVTLRVTDGDPSSACADSASITITCTAPTCGAGCDDGNPCTDDVCGADQSCSHSPVADGSLCQGGNLKVKLLGFNDFHGQLSAGRLVSSRPVGSAAVLTSYLRAAQSGVEDQTLIMHAGDHVGASPAASALLQDEPSIQWLNMLANSACTYADKANAACNLVATLGNHEFDEGKGELLRLLNGGNHVSGPFLEDPYQGARFPYVSANVVDEVTNRPILPPYVIKRVKGVPIAFVGAVLEATPTIVTPSGVAGLKFLDEADAANSYIPEIKAQGVRAIVLLIHQGGSQTSYTTATNTALGNSALSSADMLNVLTRLDDEFDVVVSGHAHSFTNLLVTNNGGKKLLVTQAFSASTAYGDIDLTIDPVTKDVVTKSARIVTTFADVAPGNSPDPAVAAFTAAAEAKVAPLTTQVVGFTPRSFTRAQTPGGESELGNLIADAQNLAQGTQFAFMNPGGIRADLVAPAGGRNITWNDWFTIQPFGNTLVKMSLTGAQIKAVLEQQWTATSTRILQISGFVYTWDAALPIGSRVVEIRDAAGTLLDPTATYSITCNNFLAGGGDGFTVFTSGASPVGGPVDLDAMLEYSEHNNPLPIPTGGRITRLN